MRAHRDRQSRHGSAHISGCSVSLHDGGTGKPSEDGIGDLKLFKLETIWCLLHTATWIANRGCFDYPDRDW